MEEQRSTFAKIVHVSVTVSVWHFFFFFISFFEGLNVFPADSLADTVPRLFLIHFTPGLYFESPAGIIITECLQLSAAMLGEKSNEKEKDLVIVEPWWKNDTNDQIYIYIYLYICLQAVVATLCSEAH